MQNAERGSLVSDRRIRLRDLVNGFGIGYTSFVDLSFQRMQNYSGLGIVMLNAKAEGLSNLCL
jgi:hypothetical protein